MRNFIIQNKEEMGIKCQRLVEVIFVDKISIISKFSLCLESRLKVYCKTVLTVNRSNNLIVEISPVLMLSIPVIPNRSDLILINPVSEIQF